MSESVRRDKLIIYSRESHVAVNFTNFFVYEIFLTPTVDGVYIIAAAYADDQTTRLKVKGFKADKLNTDLSRSMRLRRRRLMTRVRDELIDSPDLMSMLRKLAEYIDEMIIRTR